MDWLHETVTQVGEEAVMLTGVQKHAASLNMHAWVGSKRRQLWTYAQKASLGRVSIMVVSYSHALFLSKLRDCLWSDWDYHSSDECSSRHSEGMLSQGVQF